MKTNPRTRHKASAAGTISPPANGRPSSSVITVRGARVHNLRNISLTLPRNALIVVTGVSGSGKSSLAFDTIYAEGQRRYVESLSSYARQFLERMEKPDVDHIEGISPAIAIEQKSSTRNPRSTVGTTTEIYDYLRLLFGRVGKTYCRVCGKVVRKDSVSDVVDRVLQEPEGTRLAICFPLPDHPGRSVREECAALKQRGFFRLYVGDALIDLNEKEGGCRSKRNVDVVVDRFIVRRGDPESASRLADSVQTAFVEGHGAAVIRRTDGDASLKFSQHYECPDDGIRYETPEPRLFSFNNPVGACPSCQGFGRTIGIDMDLVVPDPSKTIREGAILPWTFPRWRENLSDLLRVASREGVPVNVPFTDLTTEQVAVVMNGADGFDGLHKFFKYIERKSYKVQYRVFLSRFRGYTQCEECGGSRLRKDVLNIRIADRNIHDVVRMNIGSARKFFDELALSKEDEAIARQILSEIRKRLRVLDEIGLGYLTLDRLTMTLSGGESQRINLATSLGSALMGALYVLDEPTIGLHPRDNSRLIKVLESLRDVGNTVLVVEHDEEMMRAADVIVDMGPHAGENGGEIVAQGTLEEIARNSTSLTAQYLTGAKTIPVPATRRKGAERSIMVRGASEHNLRSVDVRIPLSMFVCVTGVSGSGKSTLVHDVLYAGLQKRKGGFEGTAGRVRDIEGAEFVARVEMVDQSPIGRSPRSNAVTSINAFDHIRDLLASTPAARAHGFTPGYFSFNVPGGRCETCEGDGVQQIEMQFLADVFLTCDSCKGKRFRKEVLAVRYRGKNVDDILRMTVSEAIAFFQASPDGMRVAKRLRVLDEVGLAYLRLGQPATTLSGGEAQRIKLANHLTAAAGEGKALFIFDEPTTGLHFDDIARLLKALNALVDAGHSVLVIEHNMDVVKCADFVIDLGPEAGESGGRIVAAGTPEQVAGVESSATGRALRGRLGLSANRGK